MWRSDADFAIWFTQQLAAAPFDAFFWETPPVALSTLDLPFEMALTKCTFRAWDPQGNAFTRSAGALLRNRFVSSPPYPRILITANSVI